MIVLTKEQKSMLLYAETCMVDNRGRIDGRRINKTDIKSAEELKKMGLLDFGRIKFSGISELQSRLIRTSTHWVRFTEEGWAAAHALRRERSARMMEISRLKPVYGEPEYPNEFDVK